MIAHPATFRKTSESSTISTPSFCQFAYVPNIKEIDRDIKYTVHEKEQQEDHFGPQPLPLILRAPRRRRACSVHPEDAHRPPVPHRLHGAVLQLVANVEGLHLGSAENCFFYSGLVSRMPSYRNEVSPSTMVWEST